MAARRGRTAFSQELFEEQLQSMRKANATCDLGSLSQVNLRHDADDSDSEADDGHVLSRSGTPESARPSSPAHSAGSGSGACANPLEQSLLEAIQALQDPNIGRVFKMFVEYVNQMRRDILNDVQKNSRRRDAFLEEKKPTKSAFLQDISEPRKGHVPRWLDSSSVGLQSDVTASSPVGSWAASATAPERPKAASRPSMRAGRPTQSSGSHSAGRESRLPSWLRVQPKNNSRPPALKKPLSERLQTIAEPASKDEEHEDPASIAAQSSSADAGPHQDAKRSEATTRTNEPPHSDKDPSTDDAT